jgi:hypothetical protein
VLVADLDVVVRIEVAGEQRQTQGREQRVLERPPRATDGRRLAWQDTS